ncbi:MAG: hypothetical protein RSE41_10410 [Clostridia bacterium]
METRLQLSAFLTSEFSINIDKQTSLLKKLKEISGYELLPRVMKGYSVDLKEGKMIEEQSHSFVTSDGKCEIVLIPGRVDVNLNMIQNNQEIEFLKKALEIILKELSLNSNRLAYNKYDIKNIGEINFEEVEMYKKMNSPVKYYNTKKLEECNIRYSTLQNIKIDEKEEKLNVITEILTVKEINNKVNGIMIHLDINTIQEYTASRFSYANIEEFCVKVTAISNAITSSIEGWG